MEVIFFNTAIKENVIVSYVSRPKSQKIQPLVGYESVLKKAQG